jgi:hypothetical protein
VPTNLPVLCGMRPACVEGGAAVRHYQCVVGADSQWTYVKEWEYDSLASMEEIGAKRRADPDWQALVAEDEEKSITIDQRNEMYMLLD